MKKTIINYGLIFGFDINDILEANLFLGFDSGCTIG